jgi:hypothetical protein
MPTPIERYRDGYEKGKNQTLGGAAAEVMFAELLRDDPGGYFKSGYQDAINRRAFSPPATPIRSFTDRRVPKFSENPAGWLVGVLIVIEVWALWQLIKAPFQLIGALTRSEKPSPLVIAKNVIVAGLIITVLVVAHGTRATPTSGIVSSAQSGLPASTSGDVYIQVSAGAESDVDGWQSNAIGSLRQAGIDHVITGVVYSGSNVITRLPVADRSARLYIGPWVSAQEAGAALGRIANTVQRVGPHASDLTSRGGVQSDGLPYLNTADFLIWVVAPLRL